MKKLQILTDPRPLLTPPLPRLILTTKSVKAFPPRELEPIILISQRRYLRLPLIRRRIPLVHTQQEQPCFFSHPIVRVQPAVEYPLLHLVNRHGETSGDGVKIAVPLFQRHGFPPPVQRQGATPVHQLELSDVRVLQLHHILRGPYPLVPVAIALFSYAHGPPREIQPRAVELVL